MLDTEIVKLASIEATRALALPRQVPSFDVRGLHTAAIQSLPPPPGMGVGGLPAPGLGGVTSHQVPTMSSFNTNNNRTQISEVSLCLSLCFCFCLSLCFFVFVVVVCVHVYMCLCICICMCVIVHYQFLSLFLICEIFVSIFFRPDHWSLLSTKFLLHDRNSNIN